MMETIKAKQESLNSLAKIILQAITLPFLTAKTRETYDKKYQTYRQLPSVKQSKSQRVQPPPHSLKSRL